MEVVPILKEKRGLFMSMIVARMQKMKAGNLGGIQKHNQREFVNHSNKDIDVERSEANYDLANEEPVNYQNHVSEIIDSQRESTRAIRKDAVLVNEWIITSDQEFFKDLSESDTRLFFQESFNFYADIFGRQNMAYAVVHMDETTPHMHLGVVPMVNGKLSSKSVFNRKTLLEIQEELPKYLKEKGFDIERGMERSERKNLSVSTYKSVVNQAKKEAEKEVAEIKRQQKTEKQQLNQEFKKLNALKGKTENAKVAQKWLTNFEKNLPRTITGKPILDKENSKKLSQFVSGIQKEDIKTLQENHKLERKNEKLSEENGKLKKENEQVAKRRDELISEKKDLEGRFDGVRDDSRVFEDKLKELGHDPSKMPEIEYEGRLVMSKLERGIKPKNKKVAEEWLDTLKENKKKGLIQGNRLEQFMEQLKAMIDSFLSKIKGLAR